MTTKRWVLLAVLALLVGSSRPSPAGGGFPIPQGLPGNVLLIVVDDIGVDVLSTFATRLPQTPHGQPTDLPNTPNLDALAASGIVFPNAWGYPVCSPTRATILTGRYGFRTGIGTIVTNGSQFDLSRCERTLPEVVDDLPPMTWDVAHAAIGKWHLSNCLDGGPTGPNQSDPPETNETCVDIHGGAGGFEHYAGSLFNFRVPGSGSNCQSNQLDCSYFRWTKTTNGAAMQVQNYATTTNVNDALAWIAQRPVPEDPFGDSWVLYLAFNAAHSPWEVPPHGLVSPATLDRLKNSSGTVYPAGTDCGGAGQPPWRTCYLAMIEAMDAEIGRLLDSIPQAVLDRTTVILVGDNGTPEQITNFAPFTDRAKGTLYQGGINVPLVIWGNRVQNPGRVSDALVNTTDLYSTTIELATGFAATDLLPNYLALDSVSLVSVIEEWGTSVRDFVFAETFAGNASGEDPISDDGRQSAIRDARYKLIRGVGGEEFYDLEGDLDDPADPYEENDLLLLPGPLDGEAQAHLTALRQRIDDLLDSGMACPRAFDMLAVPEDDDCGLSVCTPTCPAQTIPVADTGLTSCIAEDGEEFTCFAGQTVHVRGCPGLRVNGTPCPGFQEVFCAP